MEPRFRQANKEARWAFLLTLGYLATWIVAGWLPDAQPGITGLPHWFEMACLLTPLLFIGLCVLMIRRVFRNISLEDHDAF